MLSDEQMSKRWQFSLLNDEQMSNWLGVKHLPDIVTRATCSTRKPVQQEGGLVQVKDFLPKALAEDDVGWWERMANTWIMAA